MRGYRQATGVARCPLPAERSRWMTAAACAKITQKAARARRGRREAQMRGLAGGNPAAPPSAPVSVTVATLQSCPPAASAHFMPIFRRLQPRRLGGRAWPPLAPRLLTPLVPLLLAHLPAPPVVGLLSRCSARSATLISLFPSPRYTPSLQTDETTATAATAEVLAAAAGEMASPTTPAATAAAAVPFPFYQRAAIVQQ